MTPSFFLEKYFIGLFNTKVKFNTSPSTISQNSIEFTMGWTTLYITGKEDFREEVKEKLEGSALKIMPGYPGASSIGEEVYDLFWVDEKVNIRQIKEAIGSKLVWKYRLRFYQTLEAFIESRNRFNKSDELTSDELALIEEMKRL